MKKSYFKYFLSATFIYFISVSQLFGQSDSSGIMMISELGSKNTELDNLMSFQGIDYYNVKFVGKGLKQKYFSVLAKEIWDGKIKNIDTIINSKTNSKMSAIGYDTLLLKLFGSKTENNKLKLFFRFPMVGITRKYKATSSKDYFLSDIGSDVLRVKIENNKYFPAFVYMLPYLEGDWKNYCGVKQSGVSVYDWGKEFKIKHYIIFEMKFED